MENDWKPRSCRRRRLSVCRHSLYSLLIFVLSGCVPWPTTYYVPTADHATIKQVNCDQAPPYEAILVSGILKTSAFYDGRQIIVGFYPSKTPAMIELDTSDLELEVNDRVVGIANLQYHSTQYQNETVSQYRLTKIQSLDERLSMTGLYFKLFIATTAADPPNLVLHIPPLIVNGTMIPAQTISFRRETQLRARFLVLNC
jgi:hypothetical protein